jgi:hypothetical protein
VGVAGEVSQGTPDLPGYLVLTFSFRDQKKKKTNRLSKGIGVGIK